MKKFITILTTTIACAAAPFTTRASLSTDYNANITAIFGTGNPNNGWTATTDSSLDLQLGLRAKQRYGAIGTQNGAGDYSFAPGTQWNIEFSVNTDPNNAGGISLASTGYSYWLNVDGLGAVNLAAFGDNQYGDNSTPNGGGAKGTFAALGGSNIIMQNSELYSWIGIPTGDGDSGHTFDLEVHGANGCVVANDQITVNGGIAAVPEPSTFATAAIMLIPLSIGFARKKMKRAPVMSA